MRTWKAGPVAGGKQWAECKGNDDQAEHDRPIIKHSIHPGIGTVPCRSHVNVSRTRDPGHGLCKSCEQLDSCFTGSPVARALILVCLARPGNALRSVASDVCEGQPAPGDKSGVSQIDYASSGCQPDAGSNLNVVALNPIHTEFHGSCGTASIKRAVFKTVTAWHSRVGSPVAAAGECYIRADHGLHGECSPTSLRERISVRNADDHRSSRILGPEAQQG
jgi:hypothetical protein